MPRIFISYRRSDSTDVTGRIYDELVRIFGVKNVFKDVNRIPAGKDFRAVIESELISSDVMLVIIGPGWLDAKDANGNRRLDDPTDFVRIEVEMGLRHVEVIPVLVKGASMPGAIQLPSNFNALAFKNARQIRDSDFNDDIKKLIVDLRTVKGELSTSRRRVTVTIVVAILLILLAFLALLSEEWRNDFFYKLGLYTATPIVVIQHSSKTPTPTAESPTNTSKPPTETATNTPRPATQTLTATPSPSDTPQPSITSTNTPNPPTNTPIYTTPATIGNTLPLTIFRDEDSLTLYVPETHEQVSLAEVVFQAEIDGQNKQFPLKNYSGFGGNAILGHVSILNSAACFRLIRNRSNNPAPLECQGGVLLLTQNLTAADVFWYDSTANQHRTVLVWRDGETVSVCAAGQTECDVELPIAEG